MANKEEVRKQMFINKGYFTLVGKKDSVPLGRNMNCQICINLDF